MWGIPGVDVESLPGRCVEIQVLAVNQHDAALMNNRPRKTPGWRTPAEAIIEENAAFRSTVAPEVGIQGLRATPKIGGASGFLAMARMWAVPRPNVRRDRRRHTHGVRVVRIARPPHDRLTLRRASKFVNESGM